MEEDEQNEKLAPKRPLNLRAIVLGTLLRWPLIAAGVALGFLGIKPLASVMKSLEKTEAKAETILNFQPVGENARYVDAKTTVATLKDTVKIRENILTARERLGLKESSNQIGKAIDAHVQKNTTLLVIETKWTSPRGAADLANTIRDVFLERYQARVAGKQQRELGDLQKRLARVRAALKLNDGQLSSFTTANKIVDIEKESRALLEEYNNYGVLFEQAQAERKIVEEQAIKLDQAISELKSRVTKESKNFAQLENLADVNTRIERLRDTINEDKESRKNIALLELKKRELERAKMLIEKGYISQAAYDKTLAEYEAQSALTADTEQTRLWKQERAKLQQQIVPSANNPNAAPSAPILQTMLVRTFDIQLQKIAVQKKVQSLIEARARVKSRLDLMPGFQQQYDSLLRNINGREKERKDIEERIAQKLRDSESTLQDFSIVSEAVAAPEPEKKPIMALLPFLLPVVTGVLGLLGAGALAWKATLILLPLPLLATLPASGKASYNQELSALALALLECAPQGGSSIAFSGPVSQEILLNLASACASTWEKRGLSVALVDLSLESASLQALRPQFDVILAVGGAAVEQAGYTLVVLPKKKSALAHVRRALRLLPAGIEPLGLVLVSER